MLRGLGAVGRAVSFAWRRSLQLRVVSLTLGLSLVVIMVLGFVLTSQITDRILEVKVRAATEEIERARDTVGGIVGGEDGARRPRRRPPGGDRRRSGTAGARGAA
ncbi:MAG: histidine kinase [Mycobacterium sp.]|nr:histidine kinase [Mycobacterium sp.]